MCRNDAINMKIAFHTVSVLKSTSNRHDHILFGFKVVAMCYLICYLSSSCASLFIHHTINEHDIHTPYARLETEQNDHTVPTNTFMYVS